MDSLVAPDAPNAQAARTKYLLLWLTPIAAGLTMVLLRGRPRAPNQMSGQEPASQDVLSRITVLIEDARAQHTRVDTKGSVLLGATGTLLAVVIAVLGVASKTRAGNPGLPITVLALAWVDATLLAAALAHLAWAVRPMHTTRGGGSPTDPSLLRALADGPSTAVDRIRRELAGGDEPRFIGRWSAWASWRAMPAPNTI